MANNPHLFCADPQSMAINTHWVRGNKNLNLTGATPGVIYIIKSAPCDLVLLDAYLVNNGAAGTNVGAVADKIKLGTDLDDDAFSVTCTIPIDHPVNDHHEITLGDTIALRTLPAGRDLILTAAQAAACSAAAGAVVLIGYPTQSP